MICLSIDECPPSSDPARGLSRQRPASTGGDRGIVLRRESQVWPLHGLDGRHGKAFVADLHDRLVDVLDAAAADLDAEFMEIHPASLGGTWIYALFRQECCLEFRAALVDRPDEISTSYAEPRNGDSHADIRALHDEFAELTRGSFDGMTPSARRRPLKVKIHHDERWFMRMPLPMFIEMALGVFARHMSCQWIVTQRTFRDVGDLQDESERCLRDTCEFLRTSRVVINTYCAHADAADSAQLKCALDLVICLLGCLQHVPLVNGEASLRWTLNPSPQEVTNFLLDRTTRFFFANFEARGGVWTTGDASTALTGNARAAQLAPGVVDLRALRGRLEHIRLLRVFHCHSFFTPYRANEDPVGSKTIGRALLESGAMFVEGSITEEPQMGYYCTLLSTLLGRPDVRMIVHTRSFEGALDYHETIRAANRLLVDRGHEAVDEAL